MGAEAPRSGRRPSTSAPAQRRAGVASRRPASPTRSAAPDLTLLLARKELKSTSLKTSLSRRTRAATSLRAGVVAWSGWISRRRHEPTLQMTEQRGVVVRRSAHAAGTRLRRRGARPQCSSWSRARWKRCGWSGTSAPVRGQSPRQLEANRGTWCPVVVQPVVLLPSRATLHRQSSRLPPSATAPCPWGRRGRPWAHRARILDGSALRLGAVSMLMRCFVSATTPRARACRSAGTRLVGGGAAAVARLVVVHRAAAATVTVRHDRPSPLASGA